MHLVVIPAMGGTKYATNAKCRVATLPYCYLSASVANRTNANTCLGKCIHTYCIEG